MSLDLPEAKKFKKSITKLYIIRTLCVKSYPVPSHIDQLDLV